MDEPFARELRLDLAGLLDPARGDHPAWASSPAAARVASATADRVDLRRHWLLVAAAAIAVLTVGTAILLAGGIRLPDLPLPWLDRDRLSDQSEPRQPREMTVTELAGLGPEQSVILDLAADPDGRHVWALAAWGTNHEPDDRVLIRSDSQTGQATAWELDATHADDGSPLGPARDGGVWVIGPDGETLHRFDATGRVSTVDMPRIRTEFDDPTLPPPFLGALDVAETADGSLWVATGVGLFRRVDGDWARVDTPGLPDRQTRDAIGATRLAVGATRLAVGADGSVWAVLVAISEDCVPGSSIVDCGWIFPLGVGRYDGAAWAYFDGDDAAPLAQPVGALEVGPDGSVWVGNVITRVVIDDDSERLAGEFAGVARFDDRAWVAWDQVELGLAGPLDVSVAPDGTILVAGTARPDSAGPVPDAAAVARFDGTRWMPLADGLPDEPLGLTGAPVTAVATLGRDVAYAATGRGLYRLAGDHWEGDATSVGPSGAALIEQTPRGEHWVIGRDGIWVLRDGRWERIVDATAVGGVVRSAAVGPDGAVWTVGSGGVARHDESGTTLFDDRTASGIALAADGHALVYGGEVHGIDVYGPTPGGDGWKQVERLTTPFGVVTDLALTHGGEVWIAGDAADRSTAGCVARLVGDAWSILDPVDSPAQCHAIALMAGPDDAIWMTFTVPEVFARTGSPVLGRYADDRWELYGLEDGIPGDRVAVGGDGTVWVAGSESLSRLVGDRWTEAAGGTFDDVRVDADGAVWAHSFGSLWRADS